MLPGIDHPRISYFLTQWLKNMTELKKKGIIHKEFYIAVFRLATEWSAAKPAEDYLNKHNVAAKYADLVDDKATQPPPSRGPC